MVVGAGVSTDPAHDGANRHPRCESTGCFWPARAAQDNWRSSGRALTPRHSCRLMLGSMSRRASLTQVCSGAIWWQGGFCSRSIVAIVHICCCCYCAHTVYVVAIVHICCCYLVCLGWVIDGDTNMQHT